VPHIDGRARVTRQSRDDSKPTCEYEVTRPSGWRRKAEPWARTADDFGGGLQLEIAENGAWNGRLIFEQPATGHMMRTGTLFVNSLNRFLLVLALKNSRNCKFILQKV